jgi:hypothetical protein
MDEAAKVERWPALRKDDAGLEKELFTILSVRADANPYASDGECTNPHNAPSRAPSHGGDALAGREPDSG